MIFYGFYVFMFDSFIRFSSRWYNITVLIADEYESGIADEYESGSYAISNSSSSAASPKQENGR